jgi:hypothetical protein
MTLSNHVDLLSDAAIVQWLYVFLHNSKNDDESEAGGVRWVLGIWSGSGCIRGIGLSWRSFLKNEAKKKMDAVSEAGTNAIQFPWSQHPHL